MDAGRVAVYATAASIVLLTLATGLPGPIDVPDPSEDVADPGTGNATVTVVSTPETATLSSGQHGATPYSLDVPAATVEVSDLRGNPVVEYSLGIEKLGYQRSSVHFLGQSGEGIKQLTLTRESFEPDRIDQQRYEGRLRIVLRGDDETVLVDEPITVEVRE